MHSHSSYERIEYYLHELKAQPRAEAARSVANPATAKHLQALLALFQENLQEMSHVEHAAAAKKR